MHIQWHCQCITEIMVVSQRLAERTSTPRELQAVGTAAEEETNR
jgi:hypothetical protein